MKGNDHQREYATIFVWEHQAVMRSAKLHTAYDLRTRAEVGGSATPKTECISISHVGVADVVGGEGRLEVEDAITDEAGVSKDVGVRRGKVKVPQRIASAN